MNRRMVRPLASAIAVVLVIVQGVGVASLFAGYSARAAEAHQEYHAYLMTQEGIYTVSDKANVIVFVLDNYDTVHLQAAVADQPDLLDEFTGFTWYQNSTAAMIPTRYGIPFLLTGQLPKPDEKFSQYLAERYERSTFLDYLQANDYSVGIYSDTLGLQYVDDVQAERLVYSKAMNFHPASDTVMDMPGTVHALATCALYRDMPWVLKPLFWFYTDQINNEMVALDYESDLSVVPYTMNDPRWYARLQEHGLSADDASGQGAYRFIHLNGTHLPYIVTREGENAGPDGSTLVDQAIGSMRMVSEYIAQLKALGVYDQTTIIITADHGNWYLTPDPLDTPATPIMLAKPAGAPAAPLQVSDAAVSVADVIPTVVAATGGDASEYGQTLFEADDPNRPRTYIMTTSDGSHDVSLLEYEIAGDALDMENWHLTGVSWAAQE